MSYMILARDGEGHRGARGAHPPRGAWGDHHLIPYCVSP
jgi:hypothetical protein